MVQYVNGFSCAINEEKGEFMLNYTQRFPKIVQGNLEDENETEIVSSLVMNTQVAERLRDALNDLLGDESEE